MCHWVFGKTVNRGRQYDCSSITPSYLKTDPDIYTHITVFHQPTGDISTLCGFKCRGCQVNRSYDIITIVLYLLKL